MKYIWLIFLSAGLAALAAGQERAKVTMPNLVPLIDFTDTDRSSDWIIVNDGVMGGKSTSSMTISDSGIAVFSGEVSLENNGGFASTRTVVEERALSRCDGAVIRVRGDGRTYQFRIRTDTGFDGLAYRHEFEAVKGEWQEISLSFSDFEPTFRGRIVDDAGPLDPARIRQAGFMIADKQAGEFKLEVDWIRGRKQITE